MTETTIPLGFETMTPAMAEARNYYRWIAQLVTPAVGQRLLDVGGGAGTLLHFFLDRERVLALDLGEDVVEHLRATFADVPQVRVLHADVTSPEVVAELQEERVDSILCTNVLEHVEDDVAMLRAFADVLRPTGGKLALQVPAHAWLYGTLDRQAGHFRRYSRRLLAERLRQSGLRVDRLIYMNSLAVPGWFVSGRLLQNDLGDDSTNAQVLFYDRYIVPLVRRVESWVKPPVGLSLLAFASVEAGS